MDGHGDDEDHDARRSRLVLDLDDSALAATTAVADDADDELAAMLGGTSVDAQPAGEATETLGEAKTPFGEAKTPLGEAKTPFIESKTPFIETKTPFIETKTPLIETKTPFIETKTPFIETKTPFIETKTPFIETKTPFIETKTPFIETKTPFIDTKTPLIEAKTPFIETKTPFIETKTPFIETKTPLDEAKTPATTDGYEVSVKLHDLQADPNNPLYSVKTFEELGLEPSLLKGLYSMRYQRPSKIQERALPLLLANPPKNMIGQSQSGTGKTAAFSLTMLSRIDFASDSVQAICLTPARELARQNLDVINAMGAFTPVKTTMAIKDSVRTGRSLTEHVVVGTPGTIFDLIRRRQLCVRNVRIFVLDEADNMLDMQGLGEQSLRIRNMMPKDCQIVLFSATFPDEVKRFASRFVPDANEITLKQDELKVEAIKQFCVDCQDADDKYDVLVNLYGLLNVGQSIIFVARRISADQIAQRMVADGHKVSYLHGGRDPTERDQVMDEFRAGHTKVLITTNVLSRGIDVLSVNVVINYDIPTDVNNRVDYETYLHRIGRTGRFGRTGISINFIHDRESWKQVKQLEEHFDVKMTQLPSDDYPEIEKIFKQAINS